METSTATQESTKNLEELLKESTKDILSDDTLKSISTLFETRVQSISDEKVKLAVEAALLKQDEEYTLKLEKVIDFVDEDHATKIEKIMETVDAAYADKLKIVVEMYENQVQESAVAFKKQLVESLDSYVNEYIEKHIPITDIQEAVKNTRATKILEQIKTLVGSDLSVVSESVKLALEDGKTQIDEAVARADKAETELTLVKEELAKIKKDYLLESKCQGLPDIKKQYLKKVLEDKSEQFIKENFDYTLKLFEKDEEKKLQELKESVQESKKESIDVVVQESKKEVVEKSPFANDNIDLYVDALKKIDSFGNIS